MPPSPPDETDGGTIRIADCCPSILYIILVSLRVFAHNINTDKNTSETLDLYQLSYALILAENYLKHKHYNSISIVLLALEFYYQHTIISNILVVCVLSETPTGTLPVLCVDGVEIGQSGAVFHYVAAECGTLI